MKKYLLVFFVLFLIGCSFYDTDGDGISDKDEIYGGTDTHNPDTDGDGVNDGQELKDGTDPTVLDVFPPVDPEPEKKTNAIPLFDELIENAGPMEAEQKPKSDKPKTEDLLNPIGLEFIPPLSKEELEEREAMVDSMSDFLTDKCLNTIAPENVPDKTLSNGDIQKVTWDGLASCSSGHRTKVTETYSGNDLKFQHTLTEDCSKPDGFNPIIGTVGTITSEATYPLQESQKTRTFVNKCRTKTQIDVAICDAGNDNFYSFVRIGCHEVKKGWGCVDPDVVFQDGKNIHLSNFEDRKQGAYCGQI